MEFDDPGRLSPLVGAGSDELHFDVEFDLLGQIRKEHEGALQSPDHHDRRGLLVLRYQLRVVLVHLLGHLLHPLVDGLAVVPLHELVLSQLYFLHS